MGWLLATTETAALAERFIQETFAKEGVLPGSLTLHSDRGTSMRSKTVAELLDDLGVVKSHSRPRTSNDNPFSEAQFKTMKYCPFFPGNFASVAEGRAFFQLFFAWYNVTHQRHPGRHRPLDRRSCPVQQPSPATVVLRDPVARGTSCRPPE